LVECYNELRLHDEALKCCNECIKINPYHIGGYYELGALYNAHLKENDLALNYLKFAIHVSELLSIVDDFPNLSLSFQLQGEILIEQGKEIEGMESLKKSILINPSKKKSYLIPKVQVVSQNFVQKKKTGFVLDIGIFFKRNSKNVLKNLQMEF
jgi:tetratricopeptide (TPR) repeat protein